jgi:hypothetical protein
VGGNRTACENSGIKLGKEVEQKVQNGPSAPDGLGAPETVSSSPIQGER